MYFQTAYRNWIPMWAQHRIENLHTTCNRNPQIRNRSKKQYNQLSF